VKRKKILADLHLHTVSSGHAYATILEYAREAKKKGLKMIAMTDHGPAMPGAPHYYHFSNLEMVPTVIEGVRILKGCEANIITADGKLDLHDSDLSKLEYVMATFHIRCGYDSQGIEKDTKVLLKAMENPYITTLAHPGNPSYPTDIPTIVGAAKERGILIEINNSSLTISRKGSRPRCLEIAKEVKKQGWKVAFGSDAHFVHMLGDMSDAWKLADEAGLTPDDIVNTDLAMLNEYIINRKKRA
jgi:putative hydrolase